MLNKLAFVLLALLLLSPAAQAFGHHRRAVNVNVAVARPAVVNRVNVVAVSPVVSFRTFAVVPTNAFLFTGFAPTPFVQTSFNTSVGFSPFSCR